MIWWLVSLHCLYGKVQKSIYFISRITDWWDWHLFYLLDLCFMTAMLIWIMIPENLSSPAIDWRGCSHHMMDPSPSNCQNISEHFLINIRSEFPNSMMIVCYPGFYPPMVDHLIEFDAFKVGEKQKEVLIGLGWMVDHYILLAYSTKIYIEHQDACATWCKRYFAPLSVNVSIKVLFKSLHLCDCTQPLGHMAPISWSRHNIF